MTGLCLIHQINLHKKGTATELLNGPEGKGGREDIDEGEDKGDEERVGNGASGLKERSRVVKDEVDTRPLLHHLERSTKNGAADVAASLPERASEAIEPAGPVTCDMNDRLFMLVIGNDLGEFGSDVLRVHGLATKSREHDTGIVNLVFLDKVTGRLGKEIKTSAEDETPSELDTDWDTIRSGIRP